MLLAFLAALVAIFYLDYLLGKAFVWDDTLFEFYPGVHYFAAAIREGRFPLWISGVYDGMPFYTDIQLGLFYPPTWLLAIFAGSGHLSIIAYQWWLVLHVFLGGLFMFWFLKDYRLRPVACLAGSIVFCFAGFTSLNIIHANRLQVYAWLPLQLLMVKRFLDGHNARYFCGLVVATLLSALAGYPQISLYAGYLVVGFWLFSWWRQQRENEIRFGAVGKEIIKMGTLMLCVLLLGAVAILPSAENWYYSSRPRMGWQDIARPSMPFHGLIGLIVPNYFGKESYINWTAVFQGSAPDPAADNRFWGFVAETDQNAVGWPDWQYQYAETGVYAGQVALLAAVVLLFNWKRLENRAVVGFFVAVSVFSIWFMLGRNAGLFAILYHTVPGISFFRGPVKMGAVLDCSAAVLVACFVNALASGRQMKLRGAACLFGIVYAGLALGTLTFGPRVFPELAEAPVRSYSLSQTCIGAGLCLACFGAAVGIMRLTDWRRGVLLTGMPLLIAADLFITYGGFYRGGTDPAEYYKDQGNIAARLQQWRAEIGPFRLAQMRDGKLQQEVLYMRNFAYLHKEIEYPDGYVTFALRDWESFQSITSQTTKIDIQNVRVLINEDRQTSLRSHRVGIIPYTNSLARVKFYRSVKFYESSERVFDDLNSGKIDYKNEIAVVARGVPTFLAASDRPARVSPEIRCKLSRTRPSATPSATTLGHRVSFLSRSHITPGGKQVTGGSRL